MAAHLVSRQNVHLVGFLPARPFHAYCLIGHTHNWFGAVNVVAQALGIWILDQYITLEQDTTISIAQIRELESFMKLQPVGGGSKLVAINATKLSKEAGHALLKSVEEPLGHTIIILCVETIDNLLPTLRSRCQIIRIDQSRLGDLGKILHRDIPVLSVCAQWSLVERFKFVETVVKKGENIIERLDFWLENLYGTSGLDERSATLMGRLLEARQQLLANVQPRLVLEYIMISLESKIKN